MTDQSKRPWADYYDRQYLTGDALPAEGRTFTIVDKSRDEVEGKDGKEHKLALTFSDGNRFLVNVTNATYIEHLFGSKFPSDWIGRKVTLQFDPSVKFGKDTVGGIRVIGSPDIDKPVTFQFQENSRKKPRTVTLQPTKTGQKQANPASAGHEAVSMLDEGLDAETGES
jgi:hypothetical protein